MRGVPRLLLILLASIVVLATQQTVKAENYTVNQNFFFFRSDLQNVYNQEAPLTESEGATTLDDLDWCLVNSNAGFVFLYCAGSGLEPVLFDGQSFLDGASSENDFQLLRELGT